MGLKSADTRADMDPGGGPSIAPVTRRSSRPARSLLLNPTLLLAAATGEATPLDLPSQAAGQASQTGGASILRTLFALVIVAALIYAVAWGLRKLRGGAVPVKAARGRGALTSEATLALAPNRAVHVVRAGREVLVLGVAEHGVSHLRSYSEEEALALGLIRPDEDADPAIPLTPDLRVGHRLTVPVGAAAAAGVAGVMVTRLRELTARG